ncbi:unnamed protein product, partial [Mesorhabditis belari]|uniref:ABC transporter domain-containing protein n=1 Tax=Mesorhabditis belari TaxID=2138241 RepID=A0AAF3EWV1_9BILA
MRSNKTETTAVDKERDTEHLLPYSEGKASKKITVWKNLWATSCFHSFLAAQLQKMDGIAAQQHVKVNAGVGIRKRVATDRDIEGLSSKFRRLSLLEFGSERSAVVQSISRKVRSARRSARQSLDSFPTCHVEKNDRRRIEEALFQAHLTSDESAVLSISVAAKEIGNGLRANYGIRTRSMAANLCHLSVNEINKKLEDLVAQIDENRLVQFSSRAGLPLELADVGGKDYAFDIINYFLHNQMPCENVASHFPEIKRAQMVDWIFWISCVVRLPNESYFLAVHLLDKALMIDQSISEMSDVQNRVVMVAAVKVAGRFELGPEYEYEMCGRLKSMVCNDKLQCQEDKINQWESQLLNFFDFAISRKHVLHFLRIFWLLMNDVMSESEKKNGWATVKGLAYIAVAQAPLMNNNPSLVAAAIMRISLHLFYNRRQLPEDKFLQVISSLLHEENQYVPIATNLLNWILSSPGPKYIPTIARVFKANQDHPSKEELEMIACELKNFDNKSGVSFESIPKEFYFLINFVQICSFGQKFFLKMRSNKTETTAVDKERDTEHLLPYSEGEASKKIIVWKDLWATVPVNERPKRINPWRNDEKQMTGKKAVLKNVYGVALPGEILAIMGGSGAGKTTLLNILTNNEQRGVEQSGVVLVNGDEVNVTTMRRMAAFVQQVDLFCGTLTVKEQLLFSASLRMGRGYTRAQRRQRVDKVINEMNLVDCQETMIGIPARTKGISVGEKKRLAFACEQLSLLKCLISLILCFYVLTDPSIFFCDEPTSGLDSFMAQQVVSCLVRLAAQGKTIVTVIHQPSAEVFKMFHKVCFMANGRTAFHGRASDICDFLEAIHDDQIDVPFDSAPADHMIKLLSVEPATKEYDIRRIDRITEAFEKSSHGELLQRIVHGELSGSVRTLQESGNLELEKIPRYSSSFLVQFWTLLKRSLLTCLRDPLLVKVKLFQVVVTALVIGLVNLRVNIRGETIQNIEGVLFNTIRDMNFLFIFPSIIVITAELPVFLREHKARVYSVDSYYWAKSFAELPQYTILPIIYSSIVYWMTGLHEGAGQFFKYIMMCIIQAYVANTMATSGACVFGEEGAAITFMPLLVLPMLVFGGFYIRYEDVPIYFRWITWISWFRFGFEALENNQWTAHGDIKNCTPPCATPNGTEVLISRDMNPDVWVFWMNSGILIAIFVLGRVFGLVALKLRVRFGK